MIIKSYPIRPVPKPRMTRGTRFSKAAKVFYAFRDAVRLLRVRLEESGCWVTFRVPMPPSWTDKQKAEMDGKPHQQTPDLDNYLKALADSVFANDNVLWQI